MPAMLAEYGPLAGVVEAVARTAGMLWQKGWAERNAGNVSVDVTGAAPGASESGGIFVEHPAIPAALAGRTFLVKATGARFRDIAGSPLDWLVFASVANDLSGYTVCSPCGKKAACTSEFPAHLGIHGLLRGGNRPEKTVLHTHPTNLIVMSHDRAMKDESVLNATLWSMHPEVKVFLREGVAFAPYETPGTEKLAAATVEGFVRSRLVLWEKHGCVAAAAGPEEAFDLIDTADKGAAIWLLCRAAGIAPEGLSPEGISDL